MDKLRKYILLTGLIIHCLITSAISNDTIVEWKSYTTKNGLPTNEILCILVDSENVVWCGTRFHGLVKFNGKNWTTIKLSNEKSLNTVKVIFEDSQGRIWINSPYGVSVFSDNMRKDYSTKDGLVNSSVMCITEDNQNNIWIGTNVGVSKFDGNNWTNITENDGLPHRQVRSIAVDSKNIKWFGTFDGLAEYDDYDLNIYSPNNYNRSSTIPFSDINKMLTASDGQVWFATSMGLVTKQNGYKWDTYSLSSGQVNYRGITDIKQDKYENVWFGYTGVGVIKFDGNNWIKISEDDGLISNNVWSIAFDKNGNKWFATEKGISKLSDNIDSISGKRKLLVDSKEAIKIAIENGIREPMRSYKVERENDSTWKVESLVCSGSNGDDIDIRYVNPYTGKCTEPEMRYITMKMHYGSQPKPESIINRDFIDSLLPLNKTEPEILLPNVYEMEYNPLISPDNKWIAFKSERQQIAISSLDGKTQFKICDSCSNHQWSENKNELIYQTNNSQIIKHNLISGKKVDIKKLDGDYKYSPQGGMIVYKGWTRPKPPPNQIIINMPPYRPTEYDELYLIDLNRSTETRITFNGFVDDYYWNKTGDTVFYYKNDMINYVTDLKSRKIKNGVIHSMDNIRLKDYVNAVQGMFVFKMDCKLVLIDIKTMKPIKYLTRKTGYYNNYQLSNDGKYIVFTIDKGHGKKIYVLENE